MDAKIRVKAKSVALESMAPVYSPLGWIQGYSISNQNGYDSQPRKGFN